MTKKLTKVEKREAARKQKQNARNMRIGGIAFVILALIAVIFFRQMGIRIEGVIFSLPEAGGQHDGGFRVSFDGTLPPTNGVHNPMWQNCGIYDEPVGAQYGVHALEHGAVWIKYNPELPEADVEVLRDKARDAGINFMLVSPYPELPEPIALSAWGAQLTVDSASDERIDKFISVYRLGRGAPESGTSCGGGLGRPIG